MSKNVSTKEIITDKALRLFNERGIENVGVRELAGELDMHVGNITYYFPTKEDIVIGVSSGLTELNSHLVVEIDDITMKGFFELYKKVFENHYKYRCLFYSLIQQVNQNSSLEKAYMSTQERRRKTIESQINNLVRNKYLKNDITNEQKEYLNSSLSFIARFWLSEARLRFKTGSKKVIFAHYLNLLAMHFMPYATLKGIRHINIFRESL